MDIQTLELLRATSEYFNEHRQQAYLVGGSVRDILLGEACVDWDVVTDGDAPGLARGLADRLGGYYAYLHDKASRVVVRGDERELVLDVAPVKGGSIEEDLHWRDFTVNAIAARLEEVVQYFEARNTEPGQWGRGHATSVHIDVIDPLNGVADVAGRCLRAVHDDVFRDDPLRMLRAVRLRMRYKLRVDEWTEGLMRRDARLLTRVADQRVHDELYAILEPDGAGERLRYMDGLALLPVLIPEFVRARGMRQPGPHFWDVLEHSLESVGALERLAGMIHREEHWPEEGETWAQGSAHAQGPSVSSKGEADWEEIHTLLREAAQQGIFRLADLTAPRMKLAALLHDIGKTVTYTLDEDGSVHFYHHQQAGAQLVRQVMARLGASKQDRRLVELVAAHHMRPGQLAQIDTVTPRAIRRYFVDLGPIGIAVALFSLADHLAALGPQPLTESWEQHVAFVRRLLTIYVRERESILPPRLVSAEELMRQLKLKPGPVVGQLLERIAGAQAEGLVRSKEEALWWAEEWLHERMR